MAFVLEDEKYNDDMLSSNVSYLPTVHIVPLLIGIAICLLGFLDMVILYAIPNNKIKENKNKLPNAQFRKPHVAIIIMHFILHTCVILVGLFVILFSFEDSRVIDYNRVHCGLIAICVITFIAYFVTIAIGFVFTKSDKGQISLLNLNSTMSLEHPVEFIFVFTQGEIQTYSCSHTGQTSSCSTKTETCYSKSGVRIPVDSKIQSEPFNFTDVPEMFYFEYQKKLVMSQVLAAYYGSIMRNIRSCDTKYSKVEEYYPLNNGTYIVSSKKIPNALKKSSRVASILFGVGVYYELYSKSVPYLAFDQYVDADISQGVDYNSIFTNQCESLGKCKVDNKKPTP